MSQAAVPRTFSALLPASALVVVLLSIVELPDPPERVVWLAPDAVEATASLEPRFIEFSADWCEPCRQMKRKTFCDTTVAARINERFVAVRHEERGGKTPEAMEAAKKRYGVESFPTIVIVDHRDRTLAFIEGYRSAEALLSELDTLERNGWRRPVCWYSPGADRLADDPLPRLYFFESGWGCPPCRETEKTLTTHPLGTDFAEKFAYVRVSGGYREVEKLYPRMAVRSIPAIVITTRDGTVLERLVGDLPAAEIRAALEGALARAADARTSAPVHSPR